MRKVLAGVLLLVQFMDEGQAHDWLPQTCCRGHDCYPVQFGSDEVSIVPGGYYINPDHFTIPFEDSRIRHGNPTDHFYICRNGRLKINPPKCLFPPEPMF